MSVKRKGTELNQSKIPHLLMILILLMVKKFTKIKSCYISQPKFHVLCIF